MNDGNDEAPDSFVRVSVKEFHDNPRGAVLRSQTQRVVVCDERGETRFIIDPPWRTGDDD